MARPWAPYNFNLFASPGLRIVSAAVMKVMFSSAMIPLGAYGNPLPTPYRRSIDPPSDAWSDTIAGIGPLILLVGEQSTKQLLCTVTGVENAFSLATAPLGLLTIVTSLLRLCGMERLRAFIGHDLEARTVAAIEMTRVNCGGVYAELMDGYLVRNTNGHPTGVAIGVSMIEGDFSSSLSEEVVRQVMECDKYKERKRRKGIPENCAQARWCMQITSQDTTVQTVDAVIEMLASVQAVDFMDPGVRRFQRRLRALYKSPFSQHKGGGSLRVQAVSIPDSADMPPSALGSDSCLQNTAPKLTYVLCFDAVSEFATAVPPSKKTATIQGLISMSVILAIYFVALWKLEWKASSGWILGFLGYFGIVMGVICGSLIIQSSCEYTTLTTLSSTCTNWVDGIIFSALAPESMDTSGSPLWITSTQRSQRFEAVWRKDLSPQRSRISSMIAIVLVLSYICHYLGLRSLSWWVSTGELAICILSAFARSISKETQARFKILEGVKMDRRCSSTGVIRVQVSERMSSTLRRPRSMDVRVYDQNPTEYASIDGERIAWYIASKYCKDRAFRLRILGLTGLFLEIVTDPEDSDRRILFVSFKGGILVEEGLAYPDARLITVFRCTPSSLAAPTPLLARAIMRQPKWIVEHEDMRSGNIPLGKVYIFSINSMMNWWTISEDRNDMADIQKHLNWPMLLVNIAFFISILTARDSDPVATALDNGFRDLNGHVTFSGLEQETSEGIVDYIKNTASVD